jgi:hypothetical protein
VKNISQNKPAIMTKYQRKLNKRVNKIRHQKNKRMKNLIQMKNPMKELVLRLLKPKKSQLIWKKKMWFMRN